LLPKNNPGIFFTKLDKATNLHKPQGHKKSCPNLVWNSLHELAKIGLDPEFVPQIP
jgi:hypothetical protein